MKALRVLLFIFLASTAAPGQAQLYRGPDPYMEPRPLGLIDALSEVLLLRPMGLVGTIVGTGFFAAVSPILGIAAISPPHDAFQRAAEVFIVTPAKFTFDRPMGVYFPDEDGEYHY